MILKYQKIPRILLQKLTSRTMSKEHHASHRTKLRYDHHHDVNNISRAHPCQMYREQNRIVLSALPQ